MGVLENKIFLSIEDTIADRVWKVVSGQITPLIEQAGKLIEQGLFDEARGVIDSFDVSQELNELDAFLKAKFVQSAIFGASQMTDPEDTIFMEKPELIDLFDNVIIQSYAIINFGMRTVQSVAFKLLNAEEEKALDIPFMDGVIKSFGGHTHAPVPMRVKLVKGEFAALFNAAVDGNMRALVDIGASLTTSRVITFGFLSEASANGIITYEVSEILDDRTCPVCELMNGKTFSVERALARTETILRLTDPASIKAAAPFPNQTKAGLAELRGMSADDLAASGFDTPPYHPLCRGIVVETGREVGSVTTRVTRLRPTRTIQTPSIPSILKPPKIVTNVQVPSKQAFTSATTHFQRFADRTITPTKVLDNLADPNISREMRKLKTRIAAGVGKESHVVNKTADGQWTPARKKVHRRIIREILSKAKRAAATPLEGEAPSYVVFGGRAGSGKSFLARKVGHPKGGAGVIDPKKYIILDADAIKELLPGYDQWNAFAYHKESAELLTRITKIANRMRLNVVHDGTMSNFGSMAEKFALFERRGYTIDGYYVFVPPQESAKRAVLRWKTKDADTQFKGRYVPLDIALGMTENEAVWDALLSRMRKWKFFDNQGSSPVLMAESETFATPVVKVGDVTKVESGFEPIITEEDLAVSVLDITSAEVWDNEAWDSLVTEEQVDEDLENLLEDTE